MAKYIIKDPVVTINGVDLSDHARSATINFAADDVDLTAFGATMKEHGKGLGDGSMSVEFFQDFASGEVDATLWPLATGTSTFAMSIKPATGAISATNPEFQMTAHLLEYSPMDGEVGAASQTTVSFVNAAQAGIVRDTTP